jgi:hypothetical protein
LGILPYSAEPVKGNEGIAVPTIHRALRPEDLQVAILKLLGEVVISYMDSGGQDVWKGDLYRLKPVKYLRPGIIPWKLVLGLLVLWTMLTVPASVWMLFTRRWATTLNGFELFKFGARNAREVNDFKGTQFAECESLRTIPGMVGMVPGMAPASSYGLIGLSECRANPKARYTFNQMEAASSRI